MTKRANTFFKVEEKSVFTYITEWAIQKTAAMHLTLPHKLIKHQTTTTHTHARRISRFHVLWAQKLAIFVQLKPRLIHRVPRQQAMAIVPSLYE